MGKRMRAANIDNYIFIVQALFSMMVIMILFKYFGFQIYDFHQVFVAGLFFTVLLAGISYASIFLGKNKTMVDFVIISLDICLLVFLFLYTGYFELKVLFFIPIIISSIKLKAWLNIALATGVGIINLVIDIWYLTLWPGNYSIETDIMFLALYVMIAWLVGSFVKIEENIRNNLYRTKERLVEQSSLLKKLIDDMPLCIVVINQKEKIIHINKAALEYADTYDKFPEEFIGLPYKEYTDLLFKEKYTYEELLILDTLHNGKQYFKEKIIRNNKFIEAIFQPVYDINNNIVYAMAIFYDITSQELFNERLKKLERMTLVGQMGASIAHEIKNPLTTIRGFLQLAEKANDKLSKNQLNLLISEIDRCNTIIADFLSVSKKSHTSQTRCNLRDILDRQLILIENDAIINNAKLHVDLEEAYLEVDENEIKQLFLNLTHNALEAIREAGNLYIRLKNKGENIILEVEDDGQGIPEELLDKIGTPFLTTKKDGTGLGLSVCRQIAEAHGAQLKITSEVGKGTKVMVIFTRGG